MQLHAPSYAHEPHQKPFIVEKKNSLDLIFNSRSELNFIQ